MEKNLPATREIRVRSLGHGRSPGGGHTNPRQYSCLENPRDRGAWRATVPGVTKSQTWQQLPLILNWVGHCSGSLRPHPSRASEEPCGIHRGMVCSRDSGGDHSKKPVLLDSPAWPQLPYTSRLVRVFRNSGSQGVRGLGTEKQDGWKARNCRWRCCQTSSVQSWAPAVTMQRIWRIWLIRGLSSSSRF